MTFEEARTQGQRIGFVCGAFDLIHPGYITLLADAKSACDFLLVGLQTDPTIDRPQKIRPVHSLFERQLILMSVRYVDQVVVYTTESELHELLKLVRPNVRILGTDYWGDKAKSIVGDEFCDGFYWHERGREWSTTELKKKVYWQMHATTHVAVDK